MKYYGWWALAVFSLVGCSGTEAPLDAPDFDAIPDIDFEENSLFFHGVDEVEERILVSEIPNGGDLWVVDLRSKTSRKVAEDLLSPFSGDPSRPLNGDGSRSRREERWADLSPSGHIIYRARNSVVLLDEAAETEERFPGATGLVVWPNRALIHGAETILIDLPSNERAVLANHETRLRRGRDWVLLESVEPGKEDVLVELASERVLRFLDGRQLEASTQPSFVDRLRLSLNVGVYSENVVPLSEREGRVWSTLPEPNGHACGWDRAADRVELVYSSRPPFALLALGAPIARVTPVARGCHITPREEGRRAVILSIDGHQTREVGNGTRFSFTDFQGWVGAGEVTARGQLTLFGPNDERTIDFPEGGLDAGGSILGDHMFTPDMVWSIDGDQAVPLPELVVEVPDGLSMLELSDGNPRPGLARDQRSLLTRTFPDEDGVVDYLLAQGRDVRLVAEQVQFDGFTRDEWVTTDEHVVIRVAVTLPDGRNGTRLVIRRLGVE